MQAGPVSLIRRKTGDWWQDDRRNWCAYCGRKLEWDRNAPGKSFATSDHVVAKCHGGSLTIPSCGPCNKAKGTRSAADFLTSPYFNQNRGKRPATEWSLRDLWLVMAMAAVHLADRDSKQGPSASA